MSLRRRQSFPADQGETCKCPHCEQQARIIEETERMVWVCSCGATGYYDDGENLYPNSTYRAPRNEEGWK